MDEDKIVEILEGLDVPEDKITQIVSQLDGQLKIKMLSNAASNSSLDLLIELEKDPLKKAALVAGKISKSFDE